MKSITLLFIIIKKHSIQACITSHIWIFGEEQARTSPLAGKTKGYSKLFLNFSHLPSFQCYTGEQLADIYGLGSTISESQALEICPALIQQIVSGACNRTEDSHGLDRTGYTEAMSEKWSYRGSISPLVTTTAYVFIFSLWLWNVVRSNHKFVGSSGNAVIPGIAIQVVQNGDAVFHRSCNRHNGVGCFDSHNSQSKADFLITWPTKLRPSQLITVPKVSSRKYI